VAATRIEAHELVHRNAVTGTIGSTIVPAPDRRAAASLLTLVALAGCGGGKARTPAPTPSRTVRSDPAETRWRGEVDRFAAALVARLRVLERDTGGGADAGPIGPRPRAALLVRGPERDAFEAARAAVGRCRSSLDRSVGAAPSQRLAPARIALVHACSALASAAGLLGSALGGARPRPELDRGALAAARVRAREGVRLVVGALAIVDRVLGGRR
jgi:hypothetical protein